ncbi:hypothetical protein G5I_11704 [Acromyrmex echinatior]|uniref:Uncharacterized protein n=1 Tax=Acromyrmex echinatior TaxID=103372 RepID=F4X0B3_ACREC|nr:hypothetical protein G5I_11704 [Acromyrmex echinatior]
MAERQEIGNYFVPNNPRVINNITERNEQQYLLLSTYSLNSSHTKKLYVGLQSTKEGTFELIVKLTSNYLAEGISFDSNAWKQFQENMGLMSTYLSGNSKIKVRNMSQPQNRGLDIREATSEESGWLNHVI